MDEEPVQIQTLDPVEAVEFPSRGKSKASDAVSSLARIRSGPL